MPCNSTLSGLKTLTNSCLQEDKLKLTFEILLSNESETTYTSVSMLDHFHLQGRSACSKCKCSNKCSKLVACQVELDNSECPSLVPYEAGVFTPPESGELLQVENSTLPAETEDCLLRATFWLNRDCLPCCGHLKNCVKVTVDDSSASSEPKYVCICSPRHRIEELTQVYPMGWIQYTPEATDPIGVTQSIGSAVGHYFELGKMVQVQVRVTVTTSGAGRGFFSLSLPPIPRVPQGNTLWAAGHFTVGTNNAPLSGIVVGNNGSERVNIDFYAGAVESQGTTDGVVTFTYQRA